MKLTIRLFAGLAEKMGGPSVTVETELSVLTAGGLKSLLQERFPEAASLIGVSFIARNHAYANPEEQLAEEDELALIPPVSGGSGEPDASASDNTTTKQAVQTESHLYELTYEPLNQERIASKVMHANCGATLIFAGTTREFTGSERTLLLEYDAYKDMAISTLKQIGDEVTDRWPGSRCAITHRLGAVAIGEASVIIAVSAPHRAECYDASRYAIERLKQMVPIWKKEQREDEDRWLGQSDSWDPTRAPDASNDKGDTGV